MSSVDSSIENVYVHSVSRGGVVVIGHSSLGCYCCIDRSSDQMPWRVLLGKYGWNSSDKPKGVGTEQRLQALG